MTHTSTHTRISREAVSAPECWNIPEKEPEVYWTCFYWSERKPVQTLKALNRPDNDLFWCGMTEADVIRNAMERGINIESTATRTPEQCTARALELGREGVGVFTYEGNDVVCVNYWLVGDPLR